MSLQKFLVTPTRFRYARKVFKDTKIKILDIGCGNDAASLTKRWFPGCVYHGSDIQEYNLSQLDRQSIDSFFPCTADYRGYEAIENEAYDFVIANHVLEHTDDPARLAKIAACKVKAGGLLWIAYPSFKSLSLPPGLDGYTNNFCDDPTHITVVDTILVCNALLASGIRILAAGRSRDAVRALTGALTLPLNLFRLATRGGLGRGTWYITGFEDRILGVKHQGHARQVKGA